MDIVDVIFICAIVFTGVCMSNVVLSLMHSTGLKEKDVVIGGKYYISNSQRRNPFDADLYLVCEVIDMKKNCFGEMWVKYQFKDGSGNECSINSFINQFSKYED